MNDPRLLVLDLETYFDGEFSLSNLPIPVYVADPRFRVHGLALRHPERGTSFRTDVEAAVRELRDEFGDELEHITVVCHHAHFDLYVLAKEYGLHPRFFIDTLSLGNHVVGRKGEGNGEGVSLKALAERYGLPRKGDPEFMSGVRLPTVEQQADLADYARNDVEITYQMALRLLPEITRPEVELPLIMHTVRLFTQGGLRVDRAGVEAMEASLHAAKETLASSAGVTEPMLRSNPRFAEELQRRLKTAGRELKYKPGRNGDIPAIARNDEFLQSLANDPDPAVASLVKARIGVRSADTTLARLATLKAISKATDGRLPPYLAYHGAHTGRFSGGDGFNIQNLPRTSDLRGLLLPREGEVFIIADLAQVEARVTAFLAGEQDMLLAFRGGRDLYREFAAMAFGREVRKPREDDPPELKAEMAALRLVGKSAILGLGFGLGAIKFHDRLKGEPLLQSLFASGTLSPLRCRQLVGQFRETYPGIPVLWKSLEEAARAAIDLADGDSVCVGTIRFDRRGEVVRCFLPSGRALRYPRLRLEDRERVIRYLDDNGEQAEFMPDGPSLVYGQDHLLYGGKLVENVVQATARDLLAEAILRIEARGLGVAFHVHDEVVVMVPDDRAEEAKRIVEEEMTRVPTWASGLPINAEVRVAGGYGK